jgi:hypothetical protein
MSGVSATEFSPNTSATRAQVWTILARLAGQNVDGGNPWYGKARAWSMDRAVSDGTDPDGNITREQLVTMLWRFAGSPSVAYGGAAFADAADVSDWARTAVEWAAARGIVTGRPGNLFDPQAGATRAEIAAIAGRFLQAG